MPVTKTAKRALRVAKRKETINKALTTRLEIATRVAKKSKKEEDLRKAISLIDRCAKKGIFHRNKAARMKSQLAKAVSQKAKKEAKK